MGGSVSTVRITAQDAAHVANIDGAVISALELGHVRLVSAAYLLRHSTKKLCRQQDLASIKGALLTPQQAVKLMRAADRRVFAVSYGWLSAGSPDPFGKRLEAIQQALLWLRGRKLLPRDAGVFLDFCSLPQKPRTAAEDAAFQAGLGSMANLYASALGVTVLQLKAVPPRPKEVAGAVRVLRLPRLASESTALLQRSYERFGELLEVRACAEREATVRFATREAARKAIAFDPAALGLGSEVVVVPEYNDRAYDHRGAHSREHRYRVPNRS
jgi:hypothetical protein